MLIPAFTIRLGQQVTENLVVVGKFDGKAPSLACATTGGKILLHSPHEGSQQETDNQLPSVRYLNFNRKISSLTAGLLPGKTNPNSTVELLFVGTESNLLAYDVDRNSDVFFREVPDGVNAVVVGKLSGAANPITVTGGNCSILGFDAAGEEVYWTVTSDVVSAMCLADTNGDGTKELVVASDDFEIRVFHNEEVIGEVSESDRAILLTECDKNAFAYGLQNGRAGVYLNSSTRAWHVKTKHRPTALISHDFTGEGVPQIVSAWSNGSFNVRHSDNGEVMFRSSMNTAISGMVRADYRMDGKEELIVVTESGEVRGFLSADVEQMAMTNQDAGLEQVKTQDEKALEELQIKKLELIKELRMLEQTTAQPVVTKTGDPPPGALPGDTALTYQLEPDVEAGFVALRVSVSTEVHIVNLLAIDLDGTVIEGNEILAVSPPTHSRMGILPLRPSKNQGSRLRVQTHLSVRALTQQLHVFETEVDIPKFCSFKMIDGPDSGPSPNSQVVIQIKESVDRLNSWLCANFLTPQDIRYTLSKDRLKVYFTQCYSMMKPTAGMQSEAAFQGIQPLHIIANLKSDGDKNGSVLVVKIRCNSMDLAGDIIQDMANYFKFTDLESEADFPDEMQRFEEVVNRVADCNDARLRLAADMADDSQRVKALVIRAEDSRLMNDMDGMRRAYTELFTLNNQLVVGYNVRASNHEALLAALKEVNLMIQKAASLRVGKPKTTVISDCRAAVKANNMSALYRIIKTGYDNGP